LLVYFWQNVCWILESAGGGIQCANCNLHWKNINIIDLIVLNGFQESCIGSVTWIYFGSFPEHASELTRKKVLLLMHYCPIKSASYFRSAWFFKILLILL
jgi:hypothetical protein